MFKKLALGFLAVTTLCSPTSADVGDKLRVQKVVEYLTTSAISGPTEARLMQVASGIAENKQNTNRNTNLYELLEAAHDSGATQQKVIEAMLGSLDDTWVKLYTPDEYLATRARFSGASQHSIGVRMIQSQAPEGLRVISLLPGGPAQGLISPGELIVAVDGINDFQAMNEKLSEKSDKPLAIDVVDSSNRRRTVQITPCDFRSKTAYITDSQQGVIRVDRFGPNTPEELSQALDTLGPGPVILDLRFNGGGYVDSAVECVDLFLEEDATVVTTVSSKARKVRKTKDRQSTTRPVCIIVNKYTASAAEIFSAALDYHSGAFLVGEKTYGKGSVQRFVSLPGNWAMKFTIGLYQTSAGRYIDKVGLEPDSKVDMEPWMVSSSQDSQMAEAVSWARVVRSSSASAFSR